MTEQQVPTVGRIVRYHRLDGGREHAAIITDVVELVTGATADGAQITETVVDLDIFWGHRNEEPLPPDAYIPHDPEKSPGTWSWPERPVQPQIEVHVAARHEAGAGKHRLGFLTFPGAQA